MQEQETKRRGRKPAKTTQTETISNEHIATTVEEEEKKERQQTAVPATFTMEQVQKMIEEALAKREAEKKEADAPQQQQTHETVTMMFRDEVNDENVIELGKNAKFGQITGKSATITVEKRDFIGEFRTALVQTLLKKRNLIVIDGLTDEERKVYGLDYQKGEYLEPVVYERLINMGDAILDIFPKLHPSWREMVALKFADAFDNKTLKCSRETLLKLNKISKKDYAHLPKEDVRRKGSFYGIIQRMNAAEEAEDDEE